MGIRKDIMGDLDELPVLQRYEILDKISQISVENKTIKENIIRDKALVSFLYLTACRIEEVVKYKVEKDWHRTKTKRQTIVVDGEMLEKKEKINTPIGEGFIKGLPIQKKQIDFRREEGSIVVLNVRTLKRKKVLSRHIPISIDEKTQPFIRHVEDYIGPLDSESYLFPISRQRASQICERVGLFPHYLRHMRLTHLMTDYKNFGIEELRRFTGWTDSRPASIYAHLQVEDLLEKMRGRT